MDAITRLAAKFKKHLNAYAIWDAWRQFQSEGKLKLATGPASLFGAGYEAGFKAGFKAAQNAARDE